MPNIGDTIRFEDNGTVAKIIDTKTGWYLCESENGRFRVPAQDMEWLITCAMVTYP